MNSQNTILVVDDESAIRNMLNLILTSAEYRVIEARNAEQAWQELQNNDISCILLDWMLPGSSGLSFLKRIREFVKLQSIPVILLTARGDEESQLLGFDFGADDYIVKPFSPKFLLARIKSLLRRVSQLLPEEEVLKFYDLKLDIASHSFEIGSNRIHLGPTEFRLLHFFIKKPNRVHSRLQLLEHVWGDAVIVEERTIDVHIRRLRKLLEPMQADNYIQTVRGSGYILTKP